MRIAGCFVVWGTEKAPEVHTLTREEHDRYLAWPAVKRSLAIQATFGRGMEHVVPANSVPALEMIALGYEGAHQDRVRFICAAIALGKPYGPNEPGDEPPPDGGTKVPVPKGPKPRGPRPKMLSIRDLADPALAVANR